MKRLLALATAALSLALFDLRLCAAEMAPDFTKLGAIPLFAAAREAAFANRIPVDGFHASHHTNALRPGDSVTALITVSEKKNQKSQWLLYVEAMEPTAEEKARKPAAPVTMYVGAGDKVSFAGSASPVSLRLLGPFADAKNKSPKFQDQKARIILNPGFLSIGLDQAAAALYRMRQNDLHGKFRIRPRPFTDAEIAEGKKSMAALQLSATEQRAIAGSQLALMSYIHLVQQTPGLDSLFYKVVKLPSVWSVVRNLGVTPAIQLEKQYVGPTPVATWNLLPETPCYTFPLSLQINEQPALMTTLVVAPAQPPLLGCGGIIGLLAEKPDDKNTYLLLRILSARLGPGHENSAMKQP